MNASEVLTTALATGHKFRRITHSDLPHLLRWRNEQQSVLRQQVGLSWEDQTNWWNEVLKPSYSAKMPKIMLVALDRGPGITSYGGLTNIDWLNLRAEVSFLAETQLANDAHRYSTELRESLRMYASLAFVLLGLRRLFTETWAFRKQHIKHLEDFGFRPEGCMRQHVIKEGRSVDAIIHGLLADDWILV